jgi:glycosyltransferase involved in cell wall biosynthesis
VSGRFTRRLRIAANPHTWTALAGNTRWRRRGSCPSPDTESQDPPALVRWPNRYEHQVAAFFVRPIREGFEALASVVGADLPQIYPGIVVIEVDPGDGPRKVALDYSDFTSVNADCAAEVDAYFKFQYLREGYPELTNVTAGGYVTDKPFLYEHWCHLRGLRASTRPTSEVFGRYSTRFGGPLREAAIQALRSDQRFAYSGGTRRTHHARYLREMARARVCVDLPGQGPFCCRLVEGLAMGCFIVSARHAAEMPVELRDGVELVYCEEDLSDLADICATYAHDEGRRMPIEAAAARYFDEHLHPVRMVERYLRILRDGLPHGPAATRERRADGTVS